MNVSGNSDENTSLPQKEESSEKPSNHRAEGSRGRKRDHNSNGRYDDNNRSSHHADNYEGDIGQGIPTEKAKAGPMEVIVEQNVEKAMKVLKRKLIKEGLFRELKARRYFEKPSERRKRKLKESQKKARKENARAKRIFG